MISSTLHAEVEERDGIHTIRVSGPLDSMNYDPFRIYLDSMAEAHTHIVLDCRKLTYINSRGLTLLVHYQRKAKQEFAFFGVAGLSPRARKGIELLGLSKVLTWYPTLEEAMETAVAM